MKKALTAQAIAAMAAGITLAAAVTPPVEALPEEVLDAATKAAELEANNAAAALAAVAVAEPAAAVAAAPDALTNYLQAQVREKDVEISAFAVKLAGLEARLAEQEASFPALLDIAAKSANNMQIALGGSAMDMAAMSPTLLLAEHARVSEVFQTKFKAGGVAAVDAATLTDEVPVQDALYQARLDSVRPQHKK